MKSSLLPIASLFALQIGLSGTATAEPSPVSLRVEQSTHNDTPNPKERWNRTHDRKLHIYASNQTSSPIELKVKYEIFGRDQLMHNIVKVNEGEYPLEVKAHETGSVDSTEAKTTSTDQRFDPKLKKMADASGSTIVGAAVQVLQGDKIVAEWYEPAAMKEQWGKALPMVGSRELKPTATPAKK